MEKGLLESRITDLREELSSGIAFHATSFREIEDKAKYWLTLSLPSLFATITFSFDAGKEISTYFAYVLPAISACLFLAIFALGKTIISSPVKGGVLIPEDSQIGSLLYYAKTDEDWASLVEKQAAEMLYALTFNERQNARKGRWLQRGERLLFYGLPTAGSLAACAAFLDLGSPEWGLGTTARISAGLAIGTCSAAISITFGHISFLKRRLS